MLSIWNLSPRGRAKTGRPPAPVQLAEPVPHANGAAEAGFEGHVDRIEGNRVVGWAWDPAAPNRPLVIEVTAGSQQKLALASLERADVRATGRGDGQCGFEAVLDREAAPGETIQVRFLATQKDLIGSPIVMNVESLLRHPGKQAVLDRIGFEAQAAAFELETLARPAPIGTPRVDPYPTRADLDTLLATAAPEADPEGLISRYLEYEIHRFKLEDSVFLRGSLTERMQVLHWYLSDYGPRRGLQLPLSKAQIAFLNSPVPVIGLRSEMSVAAYGFIMNEYGPVRPDDAEHLRECLYWWCVERSGRIAPGGELITADQVRQVAFASPAESGLKFSLNYFARRFHQLDLSLHCFDLNHWLDRAAYACCLVLCCVTRPNLSRFLPRIALAELLAEMQGGTTSNLDAILRLALKADWSGEIGTMTVEAFRELLESHLHDHGLSIRKAGARAAAPPSHSALALRPTALVSAGLERGVAVIGPTQATSGLGQATRLSIDVMREAGRNPAIFDFNLDNPAPRGFGSEVDSSSLRTPRQINLLHLNAEAIPLALAYLPNAVYAKSYNIGYFFWELDKIPKCHHLALDVLDEIWVSSEYNREIYSRYTSLPVHNVGMAVEPLPEAAPVARAEFGIPPDAFVFLSTFDSYSFVERKNPLGTIAAFRRAFPVEERENVVLILKTQNRTKVFDPHQIRVWQQIDRMASEDPRIRVVDQTLSYRHLLGFKRACDAYVSLHRSEGWGFGMIEAMQLRLPVITTAYSGNMEFCSPETASLVDYELVQPTPAEYIFVERGSRWAEPSIAAAAAGLREVFEDPSAAKARADAAFHDVRDRFSTGAIARRYERRLSEIDAIIQA